MEFLIEILLELILEGGIEISSNKKVPKWIRYPMIVLILLFFTFVIVAILVLGMYILTQNIFMGIVIITIGVILLISQIIKIRKMYIDKKNDIL